MLEERLRRPVLLRLSSHRDKNRSPAQTALPSRLHASLVNAPSYDTTGRFCAGSMIALKASPDKRLRSDPAESGRIQTEHLSLVFGDR
jgi:hypothetical protein